MEIAATQPFVEVRPLKPFVGSYPCPLADADLVDDVLTEKDGIVTKTKQPRKKFIGKVPRERYASADEMALIGSGQALPANIELVPEHPKLAKSNHKRSADDPRKVLEHPAEPTVRLPADMAKDLIARGLAEAVDGRKRRA